MTSEVADPPCKPGREPALKPTAAGGARRPRTSTRFACLALFVLPAVLALACYYAPLSGPDRSAWDLVGDAKFYAYQLAHASEVGGRWWKLGEDPWVGRPYPSLAAKHPGVYEGLDVLLLSSLTANWLDPQANLHLMVLLVLSFNGWVAGWMTYRLTGRLFWAAMSEALITVNVSTAFRFDMQPHLIKYGWALLAAYAMGRYLEQPAPRRGAWLGLALAVVLQSSFYFGFLLGLAMGCVWLVYLTAGRLTLRHCAAAGVAGVTAAVAGAVFTAPVWLASRQALLADEQYFQRLRSETWSFGSQLWQYCVTPAGSYSDRFLQALGANRWTFIETWHYLGVTVLLAFTAYALARFRGARIHLTQPPLLPVLLGLTAVLTVLSLSGGPSAALFDLTPMFRCYGRAGCLVTALASVAAPVIWHALTASLEPRRRAAVCVALVALLGYEDYCLARWMDRPREEQHPAWVAWLAVQPANVRAAVFADPETAVWEVLWQWDPLAQRLWHRHATLNGGEFALLNADLRQLGCSFWRINADGLRFVTSLGYETLVFHQRYIQDNPWIDDLAWLDDVTTLGEWRVYRANAQTPRLSTITLAELLTRPDGDPPARVPVGALLTDCFRLTEPVIVDAGAPLRLIWATPEGDRLGTAAPALFQHVLSPDWPAYHIQAPMHPGTYQLQFLDANDRVLGAKSYVVDAELQTAVQTLAQRVPTVSKLTLGPAQCKDPMRLRIQNTTPYFIEAHRFDPKQKGSSRYHVGLWTAGPGEFHLIVRPVAKPPGGKPTDSTIPASSVAVPLPHDLPPYGHLEVAVVLPSQNDANELAEVEVSAVFHQVPCAFAASTQADVRLELVPSRVARN